MLTAFGQTAFGQFWCFNVLDKFSVVVVIVFVGACWCLLVPVGACWCQLRFWPNAVWPNAGMTCRAVSGSGSRSRAASGGCTPGWRHLPTGFELGKSALLLFCAAEGHFSARSRGPRRTCTHPAGTSIWCHPLRTMKIRLTENAKRKLTNWNSAHA